jgi:hypothetical protein
MLKPAKKKQANEDEVLVEEEEVNKKCGLCQIKLSNLVQEASSDASISTDVTVTELSKLTQRALSYYHW